MNNAERPLGKELPTMAREEEPNTQGGRGLVTKFPLSPALLSTSNLDNLYQASQEVRKGVNWKDSVLGFQAHLVVNLVKLKKGLRNGTYKLRKYKEFTVFEPKKRDIEATCHIDRVAQRSLCNTYLTHALTRHFIHDNGANQKGKGTGFTRNRFKCLLHRFRLKHPVGGYCAYVDIHHFLRFHTSRCRA